MARGSFLLKAAAALAVSLASLNAPSVQAADYIQVAPADAGFCSKAGVLSRIQSKFRHQVTHVPNLPNVAIVDFQNIHLRRWLPAIPEGRPIARLYCGATVQLSDGMQRPVWYLVEEGMGLAGTGYNVEFCVDGFDRWNVYSGACRILR
jgi:capsid protein